MDIATKSIPSPLESPRRDFVLPIGFMNLNILLQWYNFMDPEAGTRAEGY